MAKFATIDDYVAALPETLRPVGERSREVIDGGFPRGAGAIRWAHPTWSIGKEPVCYLKMASRDHLTFGFWKGASLADPSGRLETTGKVMAHVKLRSLEDVDERLFKSWIRQARLMADDRPAS